MTAVVGHRPLTPEERRTLTFSWPWAIFRVSLGRVGRFVLWFVLCFLLMAVLGSAIDALFQRSFGIALYTRSDNWPVIVPIFAIVWGAILGIPAYLAVRSFRRELRHYRLRRLDCSRGTVELIDLHEPDDAVVHDNDGRWLYLFDIDGRTTLVLDVAKIGGWPELFGIDPDAFEENDEAESFESEDDIGPDIPFPNSAFIVHRLLDSGRVLRIELRGRALPLSQIHALRRPYPPGIERFAHETDCMSMVIDRPIAALIDAERQPAQVAA
jgi:hypothetical protein